MFVLVIVLVATPGVPAGSRGALWGYRSCPHPTLDGRSFKGEPMHLCLGRDPDGRQLQTWWWLTRFLTSRVSGLLQTPADAGSSVCDSDRVAAPSVRGDQFHPEFKS
jgi:hypothetical protein